MLMGTSTLIITPPLPRIFSVTIIRASMRRCGARSTPPPVASDASIPIVSAWAILDGDVLPGRNVLIIDHWGRDEGCAVAELVADGGGRAEVVSRHFHPAIDFGLTNTLSLYRRLFRKGVVLTAHHDCSTNSVAAIADGDVTIVNCYSGAERVIPNLDMLVIVTTPVPNDELLAPLQAAGISVQAIGDCLAPRDIETAILEGHRAAREL